MSNDVFFLGAGFSIALTDFGEKRNRYPSLSKLTEKVLEIPRKQELQIHLDEISDRYVDDIERLLTYLSVDLPWQDQQTRYLNKALYFELVKNIREVFTQLEEQCEYKEDVAKDFAGYVFQNKIPIVTLNYDTLLEKISFSGQGKGYQQSNSYRGFYKQPIADLSSRVVGKHGYWATHYDDQDGKQLSPIYKLHGSINWLWSATNPSEPIYCASGSENENLRKGLFEYIIPPVLDKSGLYDHNIIKSIWNDAFDALKNAKRIFIVGFSFPATDISVEFLFKSVFCNRDCKTKIYAVNTEDSIIKDSATYIKDRYDKVFSGFNVNYEYCCNNSFEELIKNELNPKK